MQGRPAPIRQHVLSRDVCCWVSLYVHSPPLAIEGVLRCQDCRAALRMVASEDTGTTQHIHMLRYHGADARPSNQLTTHRVIQRAQDMVSQSAMCNETRTNKIILRCIVVRQPPEQTKVEPRRRATATLGQSSSWPRVGRLAVCLR